MRAARRGTSVASCVEEKREVWFVVLLQFRQQLFGFSFAWLLN